MRVVEATPHVLEFDGTTTGGDRPETTTTAAAEYPYADGNNNNNNNNNNKRRPQTAAPAYGRGGSNNNNHHHRYALAAAPDDGAADDDDTSMLSSSHTKRAAARGKRSLGRLFVGSAPLLPVTGNDVNEDASMRISIVPQVRNPEVFAPVVERRGRLAGRKGRVVKHGEEEEEEDPADAEMREALQMTLQTTKMKIR